MDCDSMLRFVSLFGRSAMAKQRKSFPLRVSQELYADLRSWADQEMRSVNAQIEFLLRQAVEKRKKSGNSQSAPKSESAPPPDSVS